jgi:hypothetical protein
MVTIKRTPKPLLELPDKVPDLIAVGYKAAAAGANNAGLFKNPDPTPAEILAATQGLEASHTATGPRTRGMVQARGPKETTLRNLLEKWGIYLVSVAETMPGQEAYVYETGGFSSRRPPHRNNDPIKLTQPKNYSSGKVRATCKAAKHGERVFYGWRSSVDAGKTWTTAPQTNDHFTDFSNIPPGTELQVQYNTTIKNVTSAWSGSATLIVK